ncbi:hypothetical protein GF386_05755 [Candidatus Pacearchaeota archaeon]|nr:hypothetical protein [Candidatus Pacearchaeota archaeon]MBD3283599.1 hypothetical protein [Candidatus Pacearchaeota archaeon]
MDSYLSRPLSKISESVRDFSLGATVGALGNACFYTIPTLFRFSIEENIRELRGEFDDCPKPPFSRYLGMVSGLVGAGYCHILLYCSVCQEHPEIFIPFIATNIFSGTYELSRLITGSCRKWRDNKIGELEQQMWQSVEVEDYETAAELRDELRVLRNG